MKPIILVDMDGPLADFETGFLHKFRKMYPSEPYITLENRKSFYQRDDYLPHLNLAVHSVMVEPGFFADLPPISGAIKALNQMLQRDWIVMICTSPFGAAIDCASEKKWWVGKHLGTEWEQRMIISHDKTFIRGDILVDDRPNAHTRGILIPTWRHVLYTYPYNLSLEVPRLTWSNWEEVLIPLVEGGMKWKKS